MKIRIFVAFMAFFLSGLELIAEELDGEYGPINVKRGKKDVPPIDTSLPESMIHITKTGRWYSESNIDGLAEISVKLISQGKLLEEVFAVSGRRHKQEFRVERLSISGSKEPAPEAIYYAPDGPVSVPLNHRNYRPLGPWWIWIEFQTPPSSRSPRRYLGLHTDFDRGIDGKGGTLGCIATHNVKDMRKIVSWFRGHFQVQPPQNIIVDWGKGSVSAPY